MAMRTFHNLGRRKNIFIKKYKKMFYVVCTRVRVNNILYTRKLFAKYTIFIPEKNSKSY